MRLSAERPRVRWLLMAAVWLAAAAQLMLFTRAISDHIQFVGTHGLRGRPAAETPFRMPYLPGSVDAQEWVEHAASLIESPRVQLRHTDIDNAPFGREVHWNSAWAWTIAAAGVLDARITGQSINDALEHATLWLNPAVFLLAIVLLSSWAARRAGAAAGIAIAVAMLGYDAFNTGFAPNFVDHHGLLAAAVLGLTMGAVFMGAGWWRQADETSIRLAPHSQHAAGRAAMASALCGAVGMWISAASVIPSIAIVGVAGALVVFICGSRATQGGLAYDASVWSTWGRTGAVVSFAFYLVEYFPLHLGMRLEVNHPLYSLAWLGGGELIAEITAWRVAAPDARRLNRKRVALAMTLVAVAPATIAVSGARVFAPLDPFLARLYREFLTDFAPVWGAEGFSWVSHFAHSGFRYVPLLACALWLLVRRRDSPPILWFAAFVVFGLTVLSWIQVRWAGVLGGPNICALLVFSAVCTIARAPRVRWLGIVALFGGLFVPAALQRITSARAGVNDRVIAIDERLHLLYRDMAAAIRASQPSGAIVLLTNPNASISVGYYGRFGTIGTAFWENRAGLKAAAELFSASTPSAAIALLRARNVTHIAMVSDEDFTPAYVQLLHPMTTEEDYARTFGYQLLTSQRFPPWLRVIPYDVPDDLGADGVTVRLFKVQLP